MHPFSCGSDVNVLKHGRRVLRVLCMTLFTVLTAGNLLAQDKPDIGSTSSEHVWIDAHAALPSRQDTLSVQGGGPFLLRQFLIESSLKVSVNNAWLRDTDFELNARDGLIHFPEVSPDSVLQIMVSYYYVPLDLATSYTLWEQATVSTIEERNEEKRRPEAVESALMTRGQITRGLLTGSNQSARIESGLRLTVEGEITPGVQLEAELTDEDTPLVPEGVTRQFDQFDRIRIGFSSEHGRIDLGDFDALLQGTRYGRLQRKLQGAGLSTSLIDQPAPGLSSFRVSAGAAISRGQFHAIDLAIKEGVQGPYRLLGASGERFILVLPGTERVFLDGVRLQRGQDLDYMMDYALGEVTFTARHLMGPDRRVRIEYEYTTNRYTRTLSFAEAELGIGGVPSRPWARLVLGGIREADGAAFVDEQGLTAEDSILVSQSTDGNVQIDGAVRVAYDPEALFTHYTRSSGSEGGVIYEAFYGPVADDQEIYRVPFTFVGDAEGDYRRIPSLTGGIAYEWVGEENGSYIAVRTLPVPSRMTLGEARIHVLAVPGVRIEAGLAGSARDRNRLSPGSDSQVSDGSWDIALQSEALEVGFGYAAKIAGTVQRRGASFETFERIRPVEFIRDWGLPISEVDPLGAIISGNDESLSEISVSVQAEDSTGIEAYAGSLQLGNQAESSRIGGRARFHAGSRLLMTGEIDNANANGKLSWAFESVQHRSKVRLERSRAVSGWSPWAEYERNHWSVTGDASQGLSRDEQIRRLPFQAYRLGVYRGWEAHSIALSGSIREEEGAPTGVLLLAGSRIQTGQGSWTYETGTRVRSEATLGMRRATPNALDQDDSAPTESERALLIGWDGQLRTKDAGTLRWTYHVRSEQTAAMQEVFIRTGQERGSYVWLDSNNDGQIQLDEYFPETTPGEGEYARTLFPSDSLESVTSAEARMTYAYLPKSDAPVWRKVRWQTSIDLRETSRTEKKTDLYLLRPSALQEAGQTINGRLRVAQQLGLFPLRRDRELGVRLLKSASLAELAAGSESATRLETAILGREAVNESLDLTLDARWMQETADSERFFSRQYEIRRWEAQPGVLLKRGNRRAQTDLMYGSATESLTNARVRTLRVPVDVYWNRSDASWRAGGEWSDSRISGGVPIGLQLYELTEGRGAGQSWMWHIHLDIQLTEVMTATLRYDGRQPSSGDTIHTGRFHLMARF